MSQRVRRSHYSNSNSDCSDWRRRYHHHSHRHEYDEQKLAVIAQRPRLAARRRDQPVRVLGDARPRHTGSIVDQHPAVGVTQFDLLRARRRQICDAVLHRR